MRTVRDDVQAFVTKDGSIIREFMHPRAGGNAAQSLAEATVPAGTRTMLHRHHVSEELYHITRGTGRMTLGDDTFAVRAGDTIAILPGIPHAIENASAEPLVLLCCCSPPYSDEDTEILDPAFI